MSERTEHRLSMAISGFAIRCSMPSDLFKWTVAKADIVLAYADRFSAEIEQDAKHHAELDQFEALKNLLPMIQSITVKG